MSMRRGQAALEFLTTYGWALLIILLMIGTISYFGILNPSKLLPSRCVASAEFSCEDYVINGDNAFLRLTQGVGKTIYVEGAGCEYAGFTDDATVLVDDIEISPGDPWSPRKHAEIQCDLSGSGLSGLPSEKVKILFNISYTLSPNGFTHVSEGEMFTEVQ